MSNAAIMPVRETLAPDYVDRAGTRANGTEACSRDSRDETICDDQY